MQYLWIIIKTLEKLFKQQNNLPACEKEWMQNVWFTVNLIKFMKQTFSCPSKNSLWIWLHQTSDKLTGSEDRWNE